MRIQWTRAARADLDRIWLFNADRNVELADRIEARIHERARTLARFPRLGRPANADGRRILSIVDIQYTLEYRPDDHVICIMRIRSTRESREDA